MCFWRCNTWIRLGLFLMCLSAWPTAVCFRDRQGPWATLSSRCYCLPRWARTPPPPRLSFVSFHYLIPSLALDLFFFLPRFSLSLFRRDLWSNWSSRLHKENQIGFHLQPVTSCVHCAFVLPLSAEKKDRFYPWHCYYYYWLWLVALLEERLSSLHNSREDIVSC